MALRNPRHIATGQIVRHITGQNADLADLRKLGMIVGLLNQFLAHEREDDINSKFRNDLASRVDPPEFVLDELCLDAPEVPQLRCHAPGQEPL
ncbi:MAG TPA: hypothetical protein VNL39_13685 [Xanthobacteraceae bacterium]|nr:hypothetical protein [Xanthobacteraceae bacterium]